MVAEAQIRRLSSLELAAKENPENGDDSIIDIQ